MAIANRAQLSRATVLIALAAPGFAQAPDLELPARGPGARSGSAVLPLLVGKNVSERERILWQEFTTGNVPTFLRRFVAVTFQRRDRNGATRNVRVYVLPDYLALGGDHDFFRIPMTPTLGQLLANRLGCSLPTRSLVNAIWRATPVQLDPVTFDPRQYDIVSPTLFHRHHLRIEQQRAPFPLGNLVAGTKKDVVISARLATARNKVVIYGWHRKNGVPIQPLYSGHVDHYADYSHGVRLVHRQIEVDGRRMDLGSALADPVLHSLVSDEGPISTDRYPTPPPADTAPWIDPISAAGLHLQSWRPKFTQPTLRPFAPRAPNGDGIVAIIQDPRGGTDSLRCGDPLQIDQVAQADLWCNYRPQLAADGFERVGIFARDRAAGAFDGTLGQPGACYALTWDSHDGRIQCLRIHRGTLTDLLPRPQYARSTAWRRLRIEARGTSLRFLVDNRVLLTATDATHPAGEFGVGHHENFRTNSHAQGAIADNWLADVPDALQLRYSQDPAGQLTIATSHGVPGNLCLRPVSLTRGNFPNGHFFGLDGPLDAFAAQFATQHPVFVDVFDTRGRATTLARLPAGLTLFGVAIDVTTSLPPVAVSQPIAYRVR